MEDFYIKKAPIIFIMNFIFACLIIYQFYDIYLNESIEIINIVILIVSLIVAFCANYLITRKEKKRYSDEFSICNYCFLIVALPFITPIIIALFVIMIGAFMNSIGIYYNVV